MGLGQINTNLAALKAYNQLTKVNEDLTTHQERIATGKKVQRASDDPAGYYISRVYAREISVLNRNMNHVDNASAELQLQDSKMSQLVGTMQTMEDLVLQAKSDLVTTAQKSALKLEIDQLLSEIKDVAAGLKNLSGINVGAGLTVSVNSTMVSNAVGGLALMSGASSISRIFVSSAGYIARSLSILSGAIGTMLTREEQLGAYINRLKAKGDAYTVDLVNKSAQKSVIEDSDLAEEQLSVTKFQILQQSALAMLAQANTAPQSILQLIT
jgi:flagellin